VAPRKLTHASACRDTYGGTILNESGIAARAAARIRPHRASTVRVTAPTATWSTAPCLHVPHACTPHACWRPASLRTRPNCASDDPTIGITGRRLPVTVLASAVAGWRGLSRWLDPTLWPPRL